uniref:Uncharacterized protein n=1 Tax=Noccaea caerulescens TaxID=107243 RepID=A0A1J3IDE4_NOCCA
MHICISNRCVNGCMHSLSDCEQPTQNSLVSEFLRCATFIGYGIRLLQKKSDTSSNSNSKIKRPKRAYLDQPKAMQKKIESRRRLLPSHL